MALSDEMLLKLFEKMKADKKEFPVKVQLMVAGEFIKGHIYDDGHFEEGEEATRQRAVDAPTETGVDPVAP